MKYYDWNDDKNGLLKKIRGVSFEQVVLAIFSGDLVDRVKHSSPEKYPQQKIFLVKIDDYIYSVPYVEDDEKIFRRQKMKKTEYIDKDEMELAKSLETEDWVSDLTPDGHFKIPHLWPGQNPPPLVGRTSVI